MLPSAEESLSLVEQTLDDDKAQDVLVIRLKGKTEIADYMVIANGTSQRQVGAMADHLCEKLKQKGLKSIAVEGKSQCDWVLIDGGDVIVHLFRPEVREFYNLEKMWDVDPATTDSNPTDSNTTDSDPTDDNTTDSDNNTEASV